MLRGCVVSEVLSNCPNLSFDRMRFELGGSAAPVRPMRKPDWTDANVPLARQQRDEPQNYDD